MSETENIVIKNQTVSAKQLLQYKYAKHLTLINCGISSLAQIPLEQLNHLETLKLNKNNITNFDYLQASDELQLLDISQNKFEQNSINNLCVAFANLKYLYFDSYLDNLLLFQRFFLERYYEKQNIIYNKFKINNISQNVEITLQNIIFTTSSTVNIQMCVYAVSNTKIEEILSDNITCIKDYQQVLNYTINGNVHLFIVFHVLKKCYCIIFDTFLQKQISILDYKQNMQSQPQIQQVIEPIFVIKNLILNQRLKLETNIQYSVIHFYQTVQTHSELLTCIQRQFNVDSVKSQFILKQSLLLQDATGFPDNFRFKMTHNYTTYEIPIQFIKLSTEYEPILRKSNVYIVCHFKSQGKTQIQFSHDEVLEPGVKIEHEGDFIKAFMIPQNSNGKEFNFYLNGVFKCSGVQVKAEFGMWTACILYNNQEYVSNSLFIKPVSSQQVAKTIESQKIAQNEQTTLQNKSAIKLDLIQPNLSIIKKAPSNNQVLKPVELKPELNVESIITEETEEFEEKSEGNENR
ncbi:Leucine-rich_repeat domain superfamily [Hexamita inflata]|uniref:Leucine-rich repeat domain superfamily n=1 Tax=Hexamita inflata TaxID=28002 RepID=A0AA86Q869_9EUKA|nr:Leucine-rich repeat domain superfamily [Hexamita inflata]